MDDLTVLAGPNDTGKSSVLRALRAGASTGPDELMPREVELWDGPAPGFVWFARHDPGALRFLRVCTDWRLAGLDDAAALERHEATAAPHRSAASEDRELDPILGPTSTWDQLVRLGISPNPDTTLMTGGPPLVAWIEMLERRGWAIPGAAREHLCETAGGGDAVVAYELDEWGEDQLPSWMAYLCVPPDLLPAGSLGTGLFPNLEYMRIPGAPVPVLPVGRLATPWIPVPTSVPLASFDDLRSEVETAIDSLLRFLWEPADDEDVPAGSPWHQSRDRGRSLCARSEASACCQTFGVVATRHLPSFVANRYTVELAVAPIDRWERDGRISVTLKDETSGVQFPIDDSASGHHLWLHLALLETAQIFRRKAAEFAALADPRATVDEPGSAGAGRGDATYELAILEDPETRTSLSRAMLSLLGRRAADASPDDLDLKALAVLGRPTLYLIDEPEQHLHPALQRSAAAWLQRLTEDGTSQAVLATHAHTFLNLTQRTQYLATHRGRDHTIVAAFRPDHLTATDAFASEMGFDRGELISRINVLLFVEGPADRRVIEILFEDELRIAGIQVMEMGGVNRARAVLDDALVRLTAAQLAVLVDNIPMREVRRLAGDAAVRKQAAAGSDEAASLARLLDRATQVEKTVYPFGLRGKDIIDVLDDESLGHVAPSWPGHHIAIERFRAQLGTRKTGAARKKFYETEYGLDSSVRTIERAARHMARRGRKPQRVAEIIEELERLALDDQGHSSAPGGAGNAM